ncbi:phenylalanine--tRNA ligase subunit alpha [Peptococcaceae bacterium]|nr:phenylalanine--tRNA ligase subunit alpha [Peptococcaceae bacterium]
MKDELLEIGKKAKEEIEKISNLEGLNNLRVKYFGKKGEITSVLRGISNVEPQKRPEIGAIANQIRAEIEELIEKKTKALKEEEKNKRMLEETIDVTLPGRKRCAFGNKHPLTKVLEEIQSIFLGLGFSVAEGPEVETDYYNFEALNLPKDHPARDMQDTFFINSEVLLRTHTSPVQVRVMEKAYPKLPVKIICPGKVYRRDDDATHSPMFTQVEGLAVDKRITFSDLKGTLSKFVQIMFGEKTKVRFRPSFFPFTEPSAEVDISCVICAGKGCRVCGNTGWLEILGAGMVHPKVLEMSGYNPEEAAGFAFGMGVERIAMLKYGIDDLRLFYDNDLRFLKQF